MTFKAQSGGFACETDRGDRGDGADGAATAPRKRVVRLTVLQAARRVARGQVLAARAPRDGNRAMAVVKTTAGRVFAVPDQCPHDGGLLSDGFVDGDRLVCARHGWEFDAATGQCESHRSICIESCPVATVPRAKGPFLTG